MVVKGKKPKVGVYGSISERLTDKTITFDNFTFKNNKDEGKDVSYVDNIKSDSDGDNGKNSDLDLEDELFGDYEQETKEEETYVVSVNVHMSRGLVSKDSKGTNDPYVEITCNDETKKTDPKENTVNGIWNQKIVFDNVKFKKGKILAENKNIDFNSISGFKPSPKGLYESACTLNDTWGYSQVDNNWKSPEEIFANKEKLKKLGINYLINVGPDSLGRFPLQAQEILKKVAQLEKEKNNI